MASELRFAEAEGVGKTDTGPEPVAAREVREEQPGPQYLVTEFKLHNVPAWVRNIIANLQVTASVAVAETLASLQPCLEIERGPDNKVTRAILNLFLPETFRERIANLLDPSRPRKVKLDKHGNPKPLPRVLNSYGFISVQDGPAPGTILAKVRLLEKVKTDKTDKKGRPVFVTETIAVTTGLQQLICSFIQPPRLNLLPAELQAGVAQEIGQQLMSHIGLDESDRVDQANFPTVENRDPATRARIYREALERSSRKADPFERKPYPEVQPERFARIKKTGPDELVEKLERRQVVVEEDWNTVRQSPRPPLVPLLFVTSDAVQVFRGEKWVVAGVSKADICRGIDRLANPANRVKKPEKVERRGCTSIRPYYLAIPLINPADPEVARIIKEKETATRCQHHKVVGKSGRGWDFNLVSIGVWGSQPYRPHTGRRTPISGRVLVPIELGKEQDIQFFKNSDLHPCWSRLVVRRGEYFWQLTYKVEPARVMPVSNALGIQFGLDNIVSWALVDRSGQLVEQGRMIGNPHLGRHLEKSRARTWDQRAGRWVGGTGYGRELRTITYNLVWRLFRLAIAKTAMLSVEELVWVDKKGHAAPENARFSGWNYGQMRRILEYKAPIVGLGSVWNTAQYVVEMTCPQCGAMRKKGQKKDDADTYLNVKTRLLECRKCGFSGVVGDADKALLVARWALPALRARA